MERRMEWQKINDGKKYGRKTNKNDSQTNEEYKEEWWKDKRRKMEKEWNEKKEWWKEERIMF